MEEIVSQTAKSLACWRFKINPATAKKLIRVAAEECQRASLKLRKPGLPKLFYLSHLIRDHEFFNVEARFGALYKVDQYSRRNCRTDAHVGSYRKDQISEGGLEEERRQQHVEEAADQRRMLLASCVRCGLGQAHGDQMHQPGIEPGSHRWQRCILPLDH